MYFSSNLLENVFNGYETGHSAKLIHHHSHMRSLALKFFKELSHSFGFRNELNRTNQFFDGVHSCGTVPNVQQVFQIDKALDIFGLISKHGNARVFGFCHQFLEFGQVGGYLDRSHFCSRSHNVAGYFVSKLNDRLNKLSFFLFKDSFFFAYIDKCPDFLFDMFFGFFLFFLRAQLAKEFQAG